jgi:beta-lactamase class A
MKRGLRQLALALAAAAALAAAMAGCGGMQDSLHAPWEGPVTPQSQAVEKAVDRVLRHTRGAEVAVAYLDLANGSRVQVRESEPFHAASSVKLPLLVAAWAAIDSGDLTLAQPIAVHTDFRSIVDGSTYRLNPADDGDGELYAAAGSTRPVEDLLRRMILRNSDLATNLLVERLTASHVNDVMRRLGAYEIHVVRGVEDEKAFQANFNNDVTAADLMLLLQSLYQAATTGDAREPAAEAGSSGAVPLGGPVISHRAAAAILELLETAGGPRTKIAAGLPPGTRLAHKAADIDGAGIHHDIALVQPAGEAPYVLVLLSFGFTTEERANGVMAEISQAVWQARHQPLAPAHGKSGRRQSGTGG